MDEIVATKAAAATAVYGGVVYTSTTNELVSLVLAAFVMAAACFIVEYSKLKDRKFTMISAALLLKYILYASAVMVVTYYSVMALAEYFLQVQMPKVVYGAIASIFAGNAVSVVNSLIGLYDRFIDTAVGRIFTKGVKK